MTALKYGFSARCASATFGRGIQGKILLLVLKEDPHSINISPLPKLKSTLQP